MELTTIKKVAQKNTILTIKKSNFQSNSLFLLEFFFLISVFHFQNLSMFWHRVELAAFVCSRLVMSTVTNQGHFYMHPQFQKSFVHDL